MCLRVHAHTHIYINVEKNFHLSNYSGKFIQSCSREKYRLIELSPEKSHIFIMDLFAFFHVNLIITNQMHHPHNDQKYQVSFKHFRRVTHTSNRSTQEMFLKC